MGRRKNKVPSIRIRLDGYVSQPITDPRVQVAVDWIEEHRQDRKAFPMAWNLLVAALNGELGEGVQVAVQAGNTEEALDALQDMLGAFAGEW